jgi:prolipoprotein diacylglyceryltransferase
MNAPGEAVQTIDGPADVANYLANWKRGESELILKVDGKEVKPFVPRTLALYPTQLYETVSMFLLVLVLLAFEPLKTHDGQVMAVFMVCYGIHRWLNELLRNDPRPIGFEAYGSLMILTAGVVFFLFLAFRQPKQYEPQLLA